MKPDQDIELLKIEDKHRRCDACMKKYPDIDDETCDTCNLNPIKSKEDLREYIKDAQEHPITFGINKNVAKELNKHDA